MIFTKLALVTCAFYLGISVLMDVAFVMASHVKGNFGFGLVMSRPAWGVYFGVCWLISFLMAYRILLVPIFDRLRSLRPN